jgi:molybdopterin converting factor subunit 1
MSESQGKQITIHVLFFGAARDETGSNPVELLVDSPATVDTAFAALTRRFSGLQRFGRSLLFAVNQEYASRDKLLVDNDELAIFPPVSGGK